MPVYLLHGFRWPRDGFTGLRAYSIVHNLEDCSTEYVQNEHSKREILASFRKLFPDQMKHLENLKTGQKLDLIEQYDPEDEIGPACQPYAYVGDRVVMIAGGLNYEQQTAGGQKELRHDAKGKQKATSSEAAQTTPRSPVPSGKANMSNLAKALSVNVEDVMSSGPAVTPEAWEALAELRDQIAEGQKIGWWVVYNGDPDRAFDASDEDDDNESDGSHYEEEGAEAEAEGARTPTQEYINLPLVTPSSQTQKPTQSERDVPVRGSSMKPRSPPPPQKTRQQQNQSRDPRRQEPHPTRSSYHQSTTSAASDASRRSKTSTTTTSSSTASGTTTAPRPGKQGREPPPVTLPPIVHRHNNNNDTTAQSQQPRPVSLISSSTQASSQSSVPDPPRKTDSTPESSKAKEGAKKEGLRRKFFGKKT